MTIFASRAAHDFNTDPAPFQALAGGEHGARCSSVMLSGFDRLGIEYRYAPRPEFTPATADPHNVILDIARETWDNGDSYGSAMAWLFGTLQHWVQWQDARIGTVPAEYGFRDAGVLGDAYDPETGADSEYWEIKDALDRYMVDSFGTSARLVAATIQDMIVHAAAVFDRIINQARLNGKDY